MTRELLFDDDVNGYRDSLMVLAEHHDYQSQAPVTVIWLQYDAHKTGTSKTTELCFQTWQLRELLEKLEALIGDEE